MEKWLSAALAYIPRWVAFQMRATGQPGCSLAIVHKGALVHESAYGHADLAGKIKLTPRHRFRVASHSKSFTAAGIMKLREHGKLRLDDPVGRYVTGLNPAMAGVTIGQLLSHSAGIIRDGLDSGQWQDDRPFLNEHELRADLADQPILPPSSRFKYSNHGFGLAGLVIEAVTGERYNAWIAREIIAASRLGETSPDTPIPADAPFVRGHSSPMPLGRRVVIPGENPTHALASATGFVSTAADLARFYAGLIPDAPETVLSAASRREMIRRQWRELHSSVERWYGLGIVSGTLAGWDWFGHTGGFQGYITRSIAIPAEDLAISVLTNASDGISHGIVDGALQVLAAFRKNGAPSREAALWTGRWWTLWGATDLVPMGDKVMVANPALINPLLDASEITPARHVNKPGADARLGTVTLSGGFGKHGEPARLVLDKNGRAQEFWFSGAKMQKETVVRAQLRARYAAR